MWLKQNGFKMYFKIDYIGLLNNLDPKTLLSVSALAEAATIMLTYPCKNHRKHITQLTILQDTCKNTWVLATYVSLPSKK